MNCETRSNVAKMPNLIGQNFELIVNKHPIFEIFIIYIQEDR